MVGSKFTEARFFRALGAFFDQFADHPDESGMRSHGCGTDHVEPQFFAQRGCFGIKVKQNF